MINYICENCNKEFNTKQHLETHKNRKNKCSNKTDFQCDKCNKFFKSKYYLISHQDKCKDTSSINIDDNDELKKSIKIIIESPESEDNKLTLLNIYNRNLSKDELKLIINSSHLQNEEKISLLYTMINKDMIPSSTTNNNNSYNTNSNNKTNNIQINVFGKEKLDYLDDEYFMKLLNDKNIDKSFVQLTRDIHLRNDHPENKNIKITNMNNRDAFVLLDNKWRTLTKNQLKDLLHDKNTKLIKKHYRKKVDQLDDKSKNNIKIFLNRDQDDDPVIKDVKDRYINLFKSKEIDEI